MKHLIDHARAFAATHVQDPAHADAFGRLAGGQAPQALFVTCADSRVVPALLTGARPGELFELRTAGNVVPPHPGGGAPPSGEAATIEYAVGVLGVQHVIVCGHSHCGAVRALVHGDDLAAVPAVRDWLAAAVPPHAAVRSVPAGTPDAARAVQAHVLDQVATLRDYPLVRARVADGTLTLHAWYYEVHTGTVHRHGEEDGAAPFSPL
ncbi:carbonic anhydrase [Streptomyces marincola]|uniref:Carbonic anhydrase n=1 Tax=Streptomyces marincola TaxID=2878388 RepID=A0A1W7CV21_9ACTN|nr:carbonic anhydrase [Streptomyces marincola]ARQ68615.1 carbonic anhydrase [Streptomyces marincola]